MTQFQSFLVTAGFEVASIERSDHVGQAPTYVVRAESPNDASVLGMVVYVGEAALIAMGLEAPVMPQDLIEAQAAPKQ